MKKNKRLNGISGPIEIDGFKPDMVKVKDVEVPSVHKMRRQLNEVWLCFHALDRQLSHVRIAAIVEGITIILFAITLILTQ